MIDHHPVSSKKMKPTLRTAEQKEPGKNLIVYWHFSAAILTIYGTKLIYGVLVMFNSKFPYCLSPV